MSSQLIKTESEIQPFPDHTQLPDSDGTFVKNFQEHPQSILLTDSIKPVLEKRHPESEYCIGQDCGIYWRITEPPERGAESPDWFYVPNVPADLEGEIRRSYVLWQELMPPYIVLEFVSGDGSEERDQTPLLSRVQAETRRPGKFWVYENIIRPVFYGIYEVKKASIELYVLIRGNYQLVTPNERGHYPIPLLGVELGIWQGQYQNVELPWLRWWDEQGNLLLTGWETDQQTKLQLKQTETQLEQTETQLEQTETQLEQTETQLQQTETQLEQERQRAERLAELLRSQGINPDDI
ncbi:MAG: Uma2 family endonuclease [Cyanobacteria bacterium J06592_8]